MSAKGDVLVAGPDSPLSAAVLRRLRAEGFRALPVSGSCSTGRPVPSAPSDFTAHGLVILPAVPPPATSQTLALEGFVAELDSALAELAQFTKTVLEARPGRPEGRLVLVADWAVSGLAGRTAAAAVSGGLVGLARSWALELAPEGVTANAVVVGPEASTERDGGSPNADDVAHAVAFFLDRRSSGVSGQVLSVCGGRTPGLLPF